ncbi:MAG: hypothetical protein H6624_06415 [Bdellovibrionaceae bacterium]|nr:hypothetical protein [Bdellovibrionales bacterium]MCB9083957.1 hypothetical protein [Pseudobdellovibrionaceae bacterium]
MKSCAAGFVDLLSPRGAALLFLLLVIFGTSQGFADEQTTTHLQTFNRQRAKATLKKLKTQGHSSLSLKKKRVRKYFYEFQFLTTSKVRSRDLSALRFLSVTRITQGKEASQVVVTQITTVRDANKVLQRAKLLGWKKLSGERKRAKLILYSLVETKKAAPQVMVFDTVAEMPSLEESETTEGEAVEEDEAGVDATLILRREGLASEKGQGRPSGQGSLWIDIGRSFKLNPKFEFRLGGHYDVDAIEGSEENYQYADLAGSVFQYKDRNSSLSAGVEKIQWGRLEENSTLLRLGRIDWRRGPAQPYEFLKRGDPLLRYQRFLGNWSLDVVAIPRAKLPIVAKADQLWSIVDRYNGRALGLSKEPILSQLIQLGSISEEHPDKPASGILLERVGESLDIGFYLVHAPRLIPLVIPNKEVLARIALGQPPSLAIASTKGSTFVEKSPQSTMVALDGSAEMLGGVWMFEVSHDPSYPVLNTSLEVIERSRLAWRLGLELSDLPWLGQLALRLSGDKVRVSEPITELNEFYDLGVRWWKRYSADKWELSMRSLVALGRHNLYISPQIQYLGWEPQVISLEYHYFSGAERELGGFYNKKDVISLSLRSSF